MYRSSVDEVEVVVYTIEGGGHTWPGGVQYLPVSLVGRTSANLDATETIWAFFSRHHR
jgi:polyhydroxybutyrate depolymerase